MIATWGLFHLLRKLEPLLNANALAQAQYLDKLDPAYVDLAILFSAALSLFLELALIRWQSSVLIFLAFYKNFSLLACFAGLGLGYALSGRNRIALSMVVPLLAAQFCFFLLIRVVPIDLSVNPFREQLTMGLQQGGWVAAVVCSCCCPSCSAHRRDVRPGRSALRPADGTPRESAGLWPQPPGQPVVGVVMMLVASLLWTPPLVWFAVCFLAIVLFYLRRPSSLIAGIVFSVVCTIVLAWWPIDPLWSRVYSPYQLVEIGTDSETGLTLIRAAGHYYQRIRDFPV